jgi:hypothetical protein
MRACELTGWSDSQTLMTLAAACSEAGDFASADKWQRKAVELVAEKSPEKREYRKLLKRYEASQPFRETGILDRGVLQILGLEAKKS